MIASALALAYLGISTLLESRACSGRARFAWRGAGAFLLAGSLALPVAADGAERGLPVALGCLAVGAVTALVLATSTPRVHRLLVPVTGVVALLAGALP